MTAPCGFLTVERTCRRDKRKGNHIFRMNGLTYPVEVCVLCGYRMRRRKKVTY